MRLQKGKISVFLCFVLMFSILLNFSVLGEDPTEPTDPTDTTSSTEPTESTTSTEPTTTTSTTTTTAASTFSSTDPTTSTTKPATTGTTTTKKTAWTNKDTLPTVSENLSGDNTAPTAPAPTYRPIHGPGTTAIEDGKIAVNISYDEGILSLFGFPQTEIDAKSRFWFDSGYYSSMAMDKYSLMVFIGSSATSLQPQDIAAAGAKGNALYKVDGTKVGVAIFNASLLFASGQPPNQLFFLASGPTEVTKPIKFQLPIPKSMQNDGYTVVAASISDDGKVAVLDTKVENQLVTFDVNNYGNFALLAIPKSTKTVSSIPTIAIVFFIIAAVMLLGALFLIYFYYIRKPKNNDNGSDDTPPNGDDSDVTEYIPPSTPSTPSATSVMIDDSDPVVATQPSDTNNPPTKEAKPELSKQSQVSAEGRLLYDDLIDSIKKEQSSSNTSSEIPLSDIADDNFDL